LFDHSVLLLAVLIAVIVAGSFWHLRKLQDQLIATLPVEGTRLELQTLEEIRALYTSEVVANVLGQGIEVTHDYHGKKGAIPLPATLMIELGQRMEKSGERFQIRLYSDYPFPWRKDNGPRDAFEREALTALRRNPTEPFFRFQDYKGQRVLRYAVADRMGPVCVSCHNTLPDSPKRDWKVGDVRGVLEGTRYIADVEAAAREGQSRAFWLIGAIGMLGFAGVGLVFTKQRQDARALRESATRLTADVTLRKRAEEEVRHLNDGLERRVLERTEQLEDMHKQLRDAARQAGMAEIANNVLHNVGNVLNSVNTSAGLVSGIMRDSKSLALTKAVQLMNDHIADLGDFLANDPKGKVLPGYLNKLSVAIAAEQQSVITELGSLTKSVDHINDIVATQQHYSGTASLLEPVQVGDLLEDALRINAGSLARHQVTVVKEFALLPLLLLDKHRMLQIMVNLISNAKQAMDCVRDRAPQLTLRADIAELADGRRLRIRVEDDGEGISRENMARLFSHGFTTRKNGHGFGLHSCALGAKEMGGTLMAHSDGVGKGAVFTLELPVNIAMALA